MIPTNWSCGINKREWQVYHNEEVASILRSSNFEIEFCSIKGLTSIINAVLQHLHTSRLDILELTKTQIKCTECSASRIDYELTH